MTTASRPFRSRILRLAMLALAGLVLAGLALTTLNYQRDLREARARLAGASRVADTACGPIEYATAGEGPPVLLVHGAGGGFDQSLEFGLPLVGPGYRLIAPSRFGYLRTPLPADASAAAQADAHACLLDALGIREVAVIGASAGSSSALQFALRHPDRCRGLVLLVPAVYVPRPDGSPPVHLSAWTGLLVGTVLRSDFSLWALQKLAPRLVTRALLATPPARVAAADPAEQARVRRVMASVLPVSARREGLLNDAAVIGAIGRYDLERITAPALAISVADDLFGTYDIARYTAAAIPGARFLGFADGGHLWVGHQAAVAAAIHGFLAGLASDAGDPVQDRTSMQERP